MLDEGLLVENTLSFAALLELVMVKFGESEPLVQFAHHNPFKYRTHHHQYLPLG